MAQRETVILRTGRPEVKDMIKRIAEQSLPMQVIEPPSLEACIDALIKNESAMLVVDWQLGSVEVNQILGAIRRHFKVEVRSNLLIIDDLLPAVVATAIEYSVSQIHSGPLSEPTLLACLKSLVQENSGAHPIKDILLQVSIAREKGNWAFVTPMLRHLLEQHPQNHRVMMELAENLIFEKNWDLALELLAPLLGGEVPHIRALHLSGRCYLAKGQVDEAVAVLSRAKLFNPDNLDRMVDLGHAFMANDQPGEAKAEFEQALSIDPEFKEASKGKGQAMLMIGEVNEGLALLKEVSGSREMASIFNTAAILSVRHEHFAKGRDLYITALKALGTDQAIASRLFYNLGLAYRKWEKPQKAQAAFSRSNKLDPSFAKAQKHVDPAHAASPTEEGKTTFENDEFSEVKVHKEQGYKPLSDSGTTSQEITSDGVTSETEETEWTDIDPAA